MFKDEMIDELGGFFELGTHELIVVTFWHFLVGSEDKPC
jgi:hypothetical protein